MIDQSVAHSGTPTTTREQRGVALYRDQADRIEYLDDGRYSVPSCSGEHRYLVDVRGESCSCDDSIRRGPGCKHLIAAVVADAAFASCDGCGQRIHHRDLIEVLPDFHDGLRYFDFDRVCRPCADRDGVIY